MVLLVPMYGQCTGIYASTAYKSHHKVGATYLLCSPLPQTGTVRYPQAVAKILKRRSVDRMVHRGHAGMSEGRRVVL